MFDFLREIFARRTQQQVMVNLIDMWQANRPLAQLWDVKKFTDEGYRRNSLIFACVSMIATSMAEPDLCVYTENAEGEDEEIKPEHPLVRLLYRPNARQSQTALLRAMATHLEIAGNAYLYKVRNSAGVPVELRLLRPDATRPVIDANGEIVAYAYGHEPEVTKIAVQDVIHEIANPDPIEQYRGISPIAILSRMGDLDNFAADYLRAFFLNAGIPSGMLKFKTQVPPEERSRLREQWKDRYSSVKGWHDVFVTDADVEYEEIGSKLRTMDLGSVFSETESRICSVYGVPPILVGAWIGLMRSTMANYQESRKSFYQDTLIPKWTSISDRLTADLAMADFGEDLEVRFDLEDIEALQEDKKGIREFALEAWERGVITRNESRQMLGYDEDEGGDVYKQKLTETYVDATEGALPPVPDDDEGMAILSHRELLALPAPTDLHRSQPQEWKMLHAIADAAAPKVKKKSSRRSRRRATARH